MVFAPHCPLALLAHASPPLPPPMTRKSHSLLIGAMTVEELEKCRERPESLDSAVAVTRVLKGEWSAGKDSLMTA